MTPAEHLQPIQSRKEEIERLRHGIATVLGVPVSMVWPTGGSVR